MSVDINLYSKSFYTSFAPLIVLLRVKIKAVWGENESKNTAFVRVER